MLPIRDLCFFFLLFGSLGLFLWLLFSYFGLREFCIFLLWHSKLFVSRWFILTEVLLVLNLFLLAFVGKPGFPLVSQSEQDVLGVLELFQHVPIGLFVYRCEIMVVSLPSFVDVDNHFFLELLGDPTKHDL